VTISEKGLKLLEQNHVSAEFWNIVPNVLNKKRTDACPFEKMVMNCRDVKEAFGILKKTFSSKWNRLHFIESAIRWRGLGKSAD
jgi:hypothetical protein